MIIVPKFDEANSIIDGDLSAYISNKVELQMLSPDLLKSFKKCMGIVSTYKRLREVTLHLPFGKHEILFYLISSDYRKELMELLVRGVEYERLFGVRINFLLHAGMHLGDFPGNVKQVLGELTGTGAHFLIENSLPDLTSKSPQNPIAFQFMIRFPHENIGMCLDLCHLRASEYLLRRNIDVPEALLSKLSWIHFSETRRFDGIMNKKETHGKAHHTLDALAVDLMYLGNKGVDLHTTPLVTEITEYDYIKRPKMLRELELLHQYASQYKTYIA